MDPESQARMRTEIADRMLADRSLLDALRAEIRPLRDSVRRIQSRSTTAISLVGTDGGNNRLEFDPFLVQLVRVVDSSNNEYCLAVVQRLDLPHKHALDAYTMAEQHETNPRSVWGYVQGLTRLSQHTPWQDTRFTLDRAASRLLATVH